MMLMVLAILGALYAAIGQATSADAAADPAATQAQVAAGAKLFQTGCSSCHGLGAQGTQSAPTLIGVGAAAADFQLSTGRMPLAGPGAEAPEKAVQYTPEQIAQLAAFVGSLSPGPAIPTAQDLDYAGADLALGGQIFRTNCTQCHNFAGAGGALSQGGSAPSLMNATPKEIYEAMLTGPGQMPVFSDQTLTPQDKQAVIKFVESIRTSPNPGGWSLGSIGPVTEGLFVWIGGILALVAAAVWIGAKVR